MWSRTSSEKTSDAPLNGPPEKQEKTGAASSLIEAARNSWRSAARSSWRRRTSSASEAPLNGPPEKEETDAARSSIDAARSSIDDKKPSEKARERETPGQSRILLMEKIEEEPHIQFWQLNNLDSEEAGKKKHAKADKNSRTKEIRSGQADSESHRMPFLIFHPESKFRLAWDLAVLLFLLYFIFAIPFRMCFADPQYSDVTQEICTSATKRSFFSLNGVEGCYVVKGCRVDVLDQVEHTCSYVLDGLNYAQLIWSTFIDFFFIFDIFVNFRTAFFEETEDTDSKEQLVTNGWSIFRKYVSSWFILDFLSCLPLDLMIALPRMLREGVIQSEAAQNLVDKAANLTDIGVEGVTQADDGELSKLVVLSKLTRILKILRLLKLMRAARMGATISKLQDSLSIGPATVQLILLMFQFGTVAHYMACLIFIVGHSNEHFDCKFQVGDAPGAICSSDDVLNGRSVSWLTDYSMVSKDYGEARIIDSTIDIQYLVSLYWAIVTMTTVGFGDIKPFTSNECISCLTVMVVGVYMFSYIMGTVSSVVKGLTGEDSVFREKNENVTVFLNARSVPKDIKLRIRNFYQYTHNNPFVERNAPEIVDLSSSLRGELLRLFRKDLLMNSTLFHLTIETDNEERVIQQLIPCVLNCAHCPDEVIFSKGDVAYAVLFIFSGEVRLVDPEAKELIGLFSQGSFIGENALLPGEERQIFTVRSHGWSDVCSLMVSDLEWHLQDFPQLLSSIRIVAKTRWSRLQTAINVHSVIKRHAAYNVTGHKVLKMISRYGGQVSENSELPALYGKRAGDYFDLPTVMDLQVMDVIEETIFKELKATVFQNETGEALAKLVFKTGADKFDWCCDWLDSPNIKDDLTAKMEEYGGPVLAWKYMTKDAPDCLAKFRTHKLAGHDPEQDRVGAAGTVPGSELEAYMKRIVFRLDAINDQLESFALFRNMRVLQKCVENCRQLARNASHNVDMLEFSSMAEPLEWTNAAEYREEEQVDILEQAEVALGLEQNQGRPQGSPAASRRASPIEFQNTLNVPTSNSPVNFNSVGKVRGKATYAFPEESQESVEHGSEQGLPGASQRGSPVEFQPIELQNTRDVPRKKRKKRYICISSGVTRESRNPE